MLVIGALATAGAAEVVWLSPPSDEDRARVAELARAAGPALDPLDLRAAATRWTPADDEALRRLDAALAQARTYETQLDGELLILRDLTKPASEVRALRDDADRARLFVALLYQGFAADRYFGADLGTDPKAEPYRASVNGRPVERPWLDAIALDPGREATPYEIAEAPQRVAYNEERRRVGSALPATLTPRDLPAGARLVVDGRPLAPDPSGNVKVGPGRHLAHVELSGRILARFDVRVASGDDVAIELPLSEVEWSTFVSTLEPGISLPPEIGALVRALGGEVWVARPSPEGPRVVALDELAARPILVEPPPAPGVAEPVPDRGASPLGASAGALAGWLSSGDFYAQDPLEAPHEVATVNAAALGGFAEGHADLGPARIGLGVDLVVTPGPWHVALTGETSTRIRPIPHLAVGLPWVQATVGHLFPYHPALGLRGELPVGPLLLRASGWAGVPVDRDRGDGTTWEALPVWVLAAGAGVHVR